MTEETIACTLTDGEQISRRERWNRLGERSLDSIVETPNGLLLVFQSSADVEQELRQLAQLEGECCAFASWTVREAGSHVVLVVQARGDAIAAVHTMFTSLRRNA